MARLTANGRARPLAKSGGGCHVGEDLFRFGVLNNDNLRVFRITVLLNDFKGILKPLTAISLVVINNKNVICQNTA